MSLKPKTRKKRRDSKSISDAEKKDPDWGLKKQVRSLYPLLSTKEVEMVVKMRKALVAIDNYKHRNNENLFLSELQGYQYQDKLITIARDANGYFGI